MPGDVIPNGVYARLDALREDIADIKRWTERHDVQHGVLADYTRDRALTLENRITSIERNVGTRSALGGIGIVLSWLAAALGLRQG